MAVGEVRGNPVAGIQCTSRLEKSEREESGQCLVALGLSMTSCPFLVVFTEIIWHFNGGLSVELNSNPRLFADRRFASYCPFINGL